MIAAFVVPNNSEKTCDFISREAAMNALDELCDRVCQYSKKQRSAMCGACALGGAFDTIEELPAEDVQPVVRCRDCVHWAESQTSKEYGSCECDALLRWEDFYCAAGRRKEQT